MMFLWKMNIVLGNIAQQGKHASVDSYNRCRTVFLSVAYFSHTYPCQKSIINGFSMTW